MATPEKRSQAHAAFIELYVRDVTEHPEDYYCTQSVRENPERYAAAAVRYLDYDETMRLLRQLQAERRARARPVPMSAQDRDMVYEAVEAHYEMMHQTGHLTESALQEYEAFMRRLWPYLGRTGPHPLWKDQTPAA